MSNRSYARKTDPQTSHDAAESIPVPAVERAMLAHILKKRRSRGVTSDEMANETGMPRVTVSPRFRPMERKGLVFDSGERRTGPSGRSSIVWKPSPYALEMQAQVKKAQKKNAQLLVRKAA